MRLFVLILSGLVLPMQMWGGYGIECTLDSPLVEETIPGTIITPTVSIHNRTSTSQEVLCELQLPPGWLSLPFDEPFFFLEAESSLIKFLAIRIPPNALAGTYTIEVTMRGKEHPELSDTCSFLVTIMAQEKLECTIAKAPQALFAGESYQVELELYNTGNTTLTCSISAESSQQFPVHLPQNAYTLTAREKQKVPITIQTNPHTLSPIMDILFLHIEQGSTHFSLTSSAEIFPINQKTFQKYLRIPMETTVAYGIKNQQQEALFEQRGKGKIAEHKEIEFFARAPLIKEANIDRDLGGPLENAFLHYSSPSLEAYGGDGIYTLSPLTMLNRFGKGGSLTLSPLPFSGKILYLEDTSSLPQKNAGSICSYHFPSCSLSLTTVYTKAKIQSPFHSFAYSLSFQGKKTP